MALAAAAFFLSACAPQAVAPSASTVPSTAASVQPAATTSAAATPNPSRTPSPAPPPAGGAPQAVRFIDAKRGWVGAQDGILATADGGATWERQLIGASIRKIWAYDETRAWALADDKTVYRTRDGVHWTAIPPTNPPIAEIDAFSPDLLWAIGIGPVSGPVPAPQVGTVLVSTDGGFIWRPVGTHTMWSVCFDTTTDGVGAEGKRLFRTTDAGRTWTPIAQLPINDDGPYWYPTLTCPNGTNFRVQVTEPNAAAGHAPYLVFRTTDGGRSWVLEFREGYTLGTTTPPNTPQLGSFPSIMASSLAGGRTWFITCTPPANAQEFLFLGPTGDVLSRGPVPISGCASDGQVVDQAHVVAVVGSTNSVIATDDAGKTWRAIYKGRPRV
ncbi:MAG: hypothetical protein M3O64_01660 [Chloroflexota bacterium]|nr:hypothetical protein [Chloroflexota bacterium]